LQTAHQKADSIRTASATSNFSVTDLIKMDYLFSLARDSGRRGDHMMGALGFKG
jgi:hypothetical protein